MGSTDQKRQRIFAPDVGLGVIAMSLLCSEIAVRYLVAYDPDGNCQLSILNRTLYLKPFKAPVNRAKSLLERYRVGQSYLMYDSTLGWVPRPGSTSENGLYYANNDGVRKSSTDEKTLTGGRGLRVVLLGDSYTHGDEVPFEQTWATYLEKKLAVAGIHAEVINLGVPGYGMDQAYLRWKKVGAGFSPDLVIFGFQPENLKRNLNILRMLYYKPSRMFLSKPRFVRDRGHLEPINLPTLSPDKLLDVYARFEEWEDRQHEYYYRPANYVDRIWLKSKLIAAVIALVEHMSAENNQAAFYAIENEPSQLALAILNEMKMDVEKRGAVFLVAAFIPKWHFQYVNAATPLPFQALLQAVRTQYDTVETAEQLYAQVKEGNLDELFSGYHYSAKANEIVAGVIAEAIAQRQPTMQRSREH
jgi:hypothetical protein